MINRSMVKFIHADRFFKKEEIDKFVQIVNGLNFTEKDYGYEIQNFHMIGSGLEPIMSKVLGEKVAIDQNRSGIFRKPKQFVHFENFDTINEWCFVVALEKTTLNIFHHLKDGIGESGTEDAESALDGWDKFNYRNLLEWNVVTNVVLEKNQGVFFRPWTFHCFDEGKLVQYYRLFTDRSLRILIMGESENRSDFARKVHENLEGSLYFNSAEERVKAKDINYTQEGQNRHAYRMLELVRKNRNDNIIIDMTAGLEETREILNPDLIIWIDENRSENFEIPREYDMKFKKIDDESLFEVLERVEKKKI